MNFLLNGANDGEYHEEPYEEAENDKRVIAQYDENYNELLEWNNHHIYLAADGLDSSQIERGLK